MVMGRNNTMNGSKRGISKEVNHQAESQPALHWSDDDEARVPPQPAGISDSQLNPSNINVNDNRRINGPNFVTLRPQ